MSYVGSDFSPTDDVECEAYALNFAAILGTGETIVSVSSYLALMSGTDALASTRLVSTPAVNGTTVSQRAGPLLGGCSYRIGFTILTTLGQTLNLYSHIPCVTAS
jgi:hypothetical protein